MANVDNPNGFQYEYSYDSSGIALQTLKAAASTEINPGDAVFIDSDGYIDICTNTTGKVYGVAQSYINSGSGENPDIQVIPAKKTSVFSGQCSGTPNQTALGTDVDIEGGTGVQELDEDGTDNTVAKLIGVAYGSEVDSANARMLFVWSTSQYTGDA